MYNPLEQFQIIPFLTLIFSNFFIKGILDLSITSQSVTAFLLFLFVTACFNVFSFNYIFFSKSQMFLENCLNIVKQMANEHIGQAGKGFYPVLVTYFLIIVISNVSGMFVYSATLTAQLIVTFFISFSAFFACNLIGINLHQEKFLNLFFPSGTPLMLAPLIVPIELISYVFRVISLSVRLFANMMAGHTLVKVIGGFSFYMAHNSGFLQLLSLIPFFVVVILIGLEIAVALIQSYVFITLLSMYLHDTVYLH
jgi:F-type H+-transporting ATPase subunit a